MSTHYHASNHHEMALFINEAVANHSAGKHSLCVCRFCVHGRRLLASYEYLNRSQSVSAGASK